MKDEYDFSDAERGKFYRKDATIRLPIYLDLQLQVKLERLAKSRGEEVSQVVEQMLRKGVSQLDDPK